HCISQWGHEYRPDYRLLGELRSQFPGVGIHAFTATATPAVRDDIVRTLRLKDPSVSVAGFDRPNLFLEVAMVSGEADKVQRIAGACREGGGIVYCATRKDVEKVADLLKDYGVDALAYHAGMSDEQRRRIQDRFMAEPDAVVCATNAFGMGVDKPELRFVVHFAVPRTVEAYYQEIGRAGRDGRPARTLLLFNHADVYVQERLLQANYPEPSLICRVWEYLRAEAADASPDAFGQLPPVEVNEAVLARRFNVGNMELGAAVRQLERADHLVRVGGGVIVREPELEASKLRVDFAALAERRERELRMLKRMADYAYHRGCRRAYLLRYFGDQPGACSGCDVCSGGHETPGQRALPVPVRPTIRKRGERDRPRCKAALRGRRPEPGDDIDYDEGVFEQLKELRATLAKAEGVPAYVIFHDRTLKAIARELPESDAEFLAVPGIGPRKWQEYGPHVREVIGRALSRHRRA
ncbi:MAG: RecQ family ATP-dependent DNA helicase, partial [Myxococcales bacterium]